MYLGIFQLISAKIDKLQELIKRIYTVVSRGNIDLKVTKEEFLQATQAYAQITPYEVNSLVYKFLIKQTRYLIDRVVNF